MTIKTLTSNEKERLEQLLFRQACAAVRAYDLHTGFGLRDTLVEIEAYFCPVVKPPKPDVHFDIVKLTAANDKENFWTVVKTVDGEIKGGDHHWLQPAFAEAALAQYKIDPDLHGKLCGRSGVDPA